MGGPRPKTVAQFTRDQPTKHPYSATFPAIQIQARMAQELLSQVACEFSNS